MGGWKTLCLPEGRMLEKDAEGSNLTGERERERERARERERE